MKFFSRPWRRLLNLLKKKGVKRIYTACPNCTLQLRDFEPEVVPIWPVLARHLTVEDMAALTGRFIWHDPCPTRKDMAQQEAVRQILALRGCDWSSDVCSSDLAAA